MDIGIVLKIIIPIIIILSMGVVFFYYKAEAENKRLRSREFTQDFVQQKLDNYNELVKIYKAEGNEMQHWIYMGRYSAWAEIYDYYWGEKRK